MAAPLGKLYPVGLQHARVYALNSLGVPDASSTSVYEGLQIVGAKAYELNIPDARRISHTGDDRVLSQDVLPRQEPSSGVLRAARNDHDVYAVLTATNAFSIGEAKLIGYATDEQGSEPTVALLCYQKAKEAGTGTRCYRAYLVPSTQAIVNPASMNAETPEFQFSLLPSAVNHHIWGSAFTANTEGFLEAEVVESVTFGEPHVVAWKGNGTATEFNFHNDRAAVSTAKIHAVTTVATDGTVTDVTGTVTKATDGVTFAVAPASGVIICCYYEHA